MAYKAEQFVAPEGSEVIGAAILSWFDNLANDLIEPILTKHQVNPADFTAENWYPFAIFSPLYRAVYEDPNGSSALVAVGKASAQNVLASGNITSTKQWLEDILPVETSYFLRNIPDEFGYIVTPTDNGYTLHNNTPIPNDMIYGYIWEGLRELREPGQQFTVRPEIVPERHAIDGVTLQIELKDALFGGNPLMQRAKD